jgi:Ni/Fe-hydrogenase subunit HybB-like protein
VQITITKRGLTLFAAGHFVLSLALFFFAPLQTLEGGRPKARVSMLLIVLAEIIICVRIERWTRRNPRYERLGLWVYLYMLVMCSGLLLNPA